MAAPPAADDFCDAVDRDHTQRLTLSHMERLTLWLEEWDRTLTTGLASVAMPNLRELELSLNEIHALPLLAGAWANLQYLQLAVGLNRNGDEAEGLRTLARVPFRSLRHLHLKWEFSPEALSVFVAAPWIYQLTTLELYGGCGYVGSELHEQRAIAAMLQVLAAAPLPALRKFDLKLDFLIQEAIGVAASILDAALWRAQCGDFIVH